MQSLSDLPANPPANLPAPLPAQTGPGGSLPASIPRCPGESRPPWRVAARPFSTGAQTVVPTVMATDHRAHDGPVVRTSGPALHIM